MAIAVFRAIRMAPQAVSGKIKCLPNPLLNPILPQTADHSRGLTSRLNVCPSEEEENRVTHFCGKTKSKV